MNPAKTLARVVERRLLDVGVGRYQAVVYLWWQGWKMNGYWKFQRYRPDMPEWYPGHPVVTFRFWLFGFFEFRKHAVAPNWTKWKGQTAWRMVPRDGYFVDTGDDYYKADVNV